MLIKVKDVDEWTAADFIRYIKSQCAIHGIEYMAEPKQSYMIIGKTLKLLRLNNKSKDWLRKQINLFVSNDTNKFLSSLIFIGCLTRTFPQQCPGSSVENLPTIRKVSDRMHRKLVKLKKAL